MTEPTPFQMPEPVYVETPTRNRNTVEEPKSTVTGLIKSNPKTATALAAVVGTLLSYVGLDYTFLSQRSGSEFWKNNEGIFKAIEPHEVSQGDVVLRIDWEGKGREIKGVHVFKVNNESIDLTVKPSEVAKPIPVKASEESAKEAVKASAKDKPKPETSGPFSQ